MRIKKILKRVVDIGIILLAVMGVYILVTAIISIIEIINNIYKI